MDFELSNNCTKIHYFFFFISFQCCAQQEANDVSSIENSNRVDDLLNATLLKLVEKKPPNVGDMDLENIRLNKLPAQFKTLHEATITDADIEELKRDAVKGLNPEKSEELGKILLQLKNGSSEDKSVAYVRKLSHCFSDTG